MILLFNCFKLLYSFSFVSVVFFLKHVMDFFHLHRVNCTFMLLLSKPLEIKNLARIETTIKSRAKKTTLRERNT